MNNAGTTIYHEKKNVLDKLHEPFVKAYKAAYVEIHPDQAPQVTQSSAAHQGDDESSDDEGYHSAEDNE